MYVAIEGANGVGKTTLVSGLKQTLIQSGVCCITSHEPSYSKLGAFVREHADEYEGITFAYMVAADRFDNAEQVILPALAKDSIVIGDRSIFSAFAYNELDGVPFEVTEAMYEGIRYPDLVILCKACEETVHSRLSKRGTFTRHDLIGYRKEMAALDRCSDYFLANGIEVITMSTDHDIESVRDNALSLLSRHCKIDL